MTRQRVPLSRFRSQFAPKGNSKQKTRPPTNFTYSITAAVNAWPKPGEQVTLKKGAAIGREPAPTVAPPPAVHKRPDASAITQAIERGTTHELERAQGKRKWQPLLVVREGRYTV